MIATLALLATAALAQEPQPQVQPPPPGVQQRQRRDPLKRFEGLDLSADQKEQLRAMFAKRDGDRRERRKAVLSVLTPEQRRRLKEARKAQGARPSR